MKRAYRSKKIAGDDADAIPLTDEDRARMREAVHAISSEDPYSPLRNACWQVRNARPGSGDHDAACKLCAAQIGAYLGAGEPLPRLVGQIMAFLAPAPSNH